MATESSVGIVAFFGLLAAFTLYVGSHREKDHKSRREADYHKE